MPLIEVVDAFRMIEAPLLNNGRAFCTVKTTPLTLVLKVVSNCSSVIFPKGNSVPLPALAKTTSRRPFSTWITAKSRSRSASLETSP